MRRAMSYGELCVYVADHAHKSDLRRLVDTIRESTTDPAVVIMIDFWDDTIRTCDGHGE
jgi:hypothetical protein